MRANDRGSILAQLKIKVVGHLQMQTDSIIFSSPCSLLLDVKIYGRDLHLLQPENAKNNLVPREPFDRRFMFLYSVR